MTRGCTWRGGTRVRCCTDALAGWECTWLPRVLPTPDASIDFQKGPLEQHLHATSRAKTHTLPSLEITNLIIYIHCPSHHTPMIAYSAAHTFCLSANIRRPHQTEALLPKRSAFGLKEARSASKKRVRPERSAFALKEARSACKNHVQPKATQVQPMCNDGRPPRRPGAVSLANGPVIVVVICK